MKKIFSILAIFAVLGIGYTTLLYAYDKTSAGGEWATSGTWSPVGAPTAVQTADLTGFVTITDGSTTTDKASTTTISNGGLIWFEGSGGTLTSNINNIGNTDSARAIEVGSGTTHSTGTIVGNIDLSSNATSYILLTGSTDGGNNTLQLGSGDTVTITDPNGIYDGGSHGVLQFLGSATVNANVGTGTALQEMDVSGGAVSISGTASATTLAYSSGAGSLSVSGKATLGAVTTASAGGGSLEVLGALNTITTVGNTGAGRFGTLYIYGTSTIGDTYAAETDIGAATTFTGLVDATTVHIDTAATSTVAGTLNATTLAYSASDGSLTVGGTATVTSVTNGSGIASEGTLTLNGGSNVIGTVGTSTANQRFGTLNINGTSNIGATYDTITNIDAATTFTGLVDATTVNIETAATSTVAGTLNATTLAYSADGVLQVTGTAAIGAVTNTTGADGAGTLEILGAGNTITTVGGAAANQRFGVLDIDGTSTIGATYATETDIGAATAFSGLLNSTTVAVDAVATSTITGALTATNLNMTSAGTLILDSDSVVTTSTLTAAATLDLDANLTGNIALNAAGATVLVADGKTITGEVTANADGRGIVTFEGTSTTGGTIGTIGGNAIAALNVAAGTLTMANDIAANLVTVDSGGGGTANLLLNGNRSLQGNLTLAATGGTLTLGINKLTLLGTGVYTQSAGSTLNLTANSSSSYGSLTATNATLTGSTVAVTVGGYIPNNATLSVINTTGGVTGTPTATSTDSFVSFTDAISGDDLILTADRSIAGFASLANNPNAQAVGAVLDNETNPSSAMTTLLNALESLSPAQIAAALNTLSPIVDEGIMENSYSALNDFVDAAIDRSKNVLTAANSNTTGVSAGDQALLSGLWAKAYGSYLDQGTRDGILGYNAWNSGTAVGFDRLLDDNLVLGISGGYAYGQVNSDANDANTSIQSAQSTIYAGYQGAPDMPYFIDGAGSFAYNWYDGSRNINIPTVVNETAKADYQGQQYGAYLDGGYNFNLVDNIRLAPIASIQWSHLAIGSYTEKGAGALDLNVNRQSYDMLESGLGAKVSTQLKYDWGSLTPEVHAKWLYDFIDDGMAVTSSFTGGGASFATNGIKPEKNGADVGGQLSFDLKNNISLIASCDAELKNGFYGVFGSGTVRYKF